MVRMFGEVRAASLNDASGGGGDGSDDDDESPVRWRLLPTPQVPEAIAANGCRGVACVISEGLLALYDIEEDEENEEDDQDESGDEGHDAEMSGASSEEKEETEVQETKQEGAGDVMSP